MQLPPIKIAHPHVISDPDILAGSPFVRGTRIPVRRIYSWFKRGVVAETLIKRYPAVGAAKVLDALAFSFDNLELIEADLARERELYGAALREDAPLLVKIAEIWAPSLGDHLEKTGK